jgi:aldehyde dehydrogenase (NAD+)
VARQEGIRRPGRQPLVTAYSDHYIGGKWTPSLGADSIDVLNPATEEVIALVPAGTAADVDAAVHAARAAARSWGATTQEERLAALTRLCAALETDRDTFAETIVAELGCPITFAREVQTAVALDIGRSYLDILARHPFREDVGNSVVLSEPAGVVAAITPWNYPLYQIIAKVVPALAAGCTVVLKPAEDTPLTARLFTGAVDRAGFPDGVFNLVTGIGAVTGRALAEHPDVDLVSFTGSTAVGRTVAEAAGRGVKRVTLELGGKSACVVLPGGDLARAVEATAASVFGNAGQTCSAWSRLLVHESRYQEAVDLATAAAREYVPGDPTDPATLLGPVVNARQLVRIHDYVAGAVREGARVVTGGLDAPPAQRRGHFVPPTVLAGVTPEMTVAQEEVFGPVLSILTYRDVDEALRIANGTDYGLAGSVWSADIDAAVAFARAMDAGQVDINGGAFNPLAPFGGCKHSGIGRELGRSGLEEYLQTKSLQF